MLICLEQNTFVLERLDLKMPKLANQTGYFVTTSTPIHVYLITGSKLVKDPFKTSTIDIDSTTPNTIPKTK